MAGHSKWKQIKRKKAVTDTSARRVLDQASSVRSPSPPRRAAATRAATPGSAPRSTRPRRSTCPTRTSIAPSRRAPASSRARRIEEVTYEGYGPGGAAIFIEATTDNANRTVAEIRHAFSRNGGNLGATNSVAWMFDRKGQIYLDAGRHDEDRALEAALEAGAEDFAREGDQYVVIAPRRPRSTPCRTRSRPAGFAHRVGRARHGAQEHRQGRGDRRRRRCSG